MNFPKELTNLSEVLNTLPGIGPKLSMRLSMFLSVSSKKTGKNVIEAIDSVIKKIRKCSVCNNATTEEACHICSNELRDKSSILIVEDPIDLYNIESTGGYNGLYHVLWGIISPINGIGPDEIGIDKLIGRIKEGDFKEVVLGLNPTIEGDATSLYIKQELENINKDLKLTRLAKGLPAGSDIEFMSSQTLSDSFKSRVGF